MSGRIRVEVTSVPQALPVGRSVHLTAPAPHPRAPGLHVLAGSGPGALLLPDVALASLVAVLAPAL